MCRWRHSPKYRREPHSWLLQCKDHIPPTAHRIVIIIISMLCLQAEHKLQNYANRDLFNFHLSLHSFLLLMYCLHLFYFRWPLRNRARYAFLYVTSCHLRPLGCKLDGLIAFSFNDGNNSNTSHATLYAGYAMLCMSDGVKGRPDYIYIDDYWRNAHAIVHTRNLYGQSFVVKSEE